MKKVVSEGGEGIVLRAEGSAYEHGRSRSMLKIKVQRDDEARIWSINAGGTYSCEM